MNYTINKKNSNHLSLLGYGCMRLSRKGGRIDQEKAEKELLYALEHGVNYFDSAYIYPGSEVSLGKFFSKGYRDKVYLATKLPHYFVKNTAQLDRYFDEQLKRLQTTWIDYYMLHMLGDIGAWENVRSLGIEDWIRKKKENAEIRNIGFSYHGGFDGFKTLLDAYDWDFCMIQYNYIDEHTQAGVSGLRYAANEKGMPVMIMEPLRGGRLTDKLPTTARQYFNEFEIKRSPAEWGLRWLFSQKEVSVVLSGMNSIEQIKENIKTASDDYSTGLTEAELELYAKVRAAIRSGTAVPCTGCSYCMPCPRGVDIPVCFSSLNSRYSEGWYTGLKEYLMCTTLRVDSAMASRCVQCGKCEEHCPQEIEIRKELKHVVKKLETPIFKIARIAAKLLGY